LQRVKVILLRNRLTTAHPPSALELAESAIDGTFLARLSVATAQGRQLYPFPAALNRP